MKPKSKRPIHPASLANLRPAKRGEARFGGQRHSAAAREKMSRTKRLARTARLAAAEHANGEKVRRKLFQAAEDKVYRDALEYLLAHQIEPAEALREIVGDREHPDRMRAVGEWLDRTHGKPTQTQRTVALTGQLSRDEIAALLAPAALLLGLGTPVAPSHGANSIGEAALESTNDPPNGG